MKKIFINKFILVLLLVLTSSVLLTACIKLKKEDDTSVSDDIENKKPGNEAYKDLPIYELSLVLPDKDGVDIDLNNYIGKKLLFVNFFATWCPPCNQELPDFEVYSKLYQDDLQFVLVDLNHTQREGSVEDVMKWYDKGAYTLPIVFDMDGSRTKDYLPHIQGIPTTFIYNEDGLLLAYISGMLTKESLDEIIEHYVK